MAKHKSPHPVGPYQKVPAIYPPDTNFHQSTASLLIHIMPHRYMELPNIKWIISVMFLSSTNRNPHVLGRILLKRRKKFVPTKNESNVKADDRVRMHEHSVWTDKKWPFATSTAYDWCTYQLSSRYYNLLVSIFGAGFLLIIE